MGEVLVPGSGIAVVAVGGYGRGELSPHSDIDLLFLQKSKVDVTPATLRGLLYPLWDAGFQVGHAVRTPKDAIARSSHDLDAATAILAIRFVAGDEEPFEEFIDRRARWITKERRGLARRIIAAMTTRYRRVDRAGWSLAPDLKEDAGGLRDIHTLVWLSKLDPRVAVSEELSSAGDVLLAAREGLHAVARRKIDRMRIDLQRSVAKHMGLDDESGTDRLMGQVHSAARSIENLVGVMVTEVVGGAGPRRTGAVRTLNETARMADGVIDVKPGAGSTLADALRLVAAHATTGRPVRGSALQWLVTTFEREAQPWDEEMRATWMEILRAPHVAGALELLDHAGGWRALMPEWRRVRGRAQYDPYHRYTVDGHLFIAVAALREVLRTHHMAERAAQEAGNLDSLFVATLLHDIGKGSGEDHSVAGEALARAAAQRMGLARDDVSDVARLVRWHLLLVDTATRRDLDDGAVISEVADVVGDARLLRLLYILSVADGTATGPEGWTQWKAALVSELYRKVLIALETGELPTRTDVAARVREVEAFEPSLAGRVQEALDGLPPSYLETPVIDMVDELRLLLRPPEIGEVRYRVDDATEAGNAVITVCVLDRPGTLARTAGVLALHRLSVLRANAYSTTTGLALERFTVTAATTDWARVTRDLEAVYAGRLALDAHVVRKVGEYHTGGWDAPQVEVLQDESTHSTVIEVRSPDALGLLYAITAALADMDLDIHVAKIDTLGARVVDVFYVRSQRGTKLSDEQAREVRRAIDHRTMTMFGQGA